MPLDNVQRFERLCSDANFLQGLADSGTELDEINQLTDTLRADIVLDAQVSLIGGLVEVSCYDENLQESKSFAPLDEEISGNYLGLSWRFETIQFPDNSSETIWRLCHCIGGDHEKHIDQHGDWISRIPVTYVTVESSTVELNSAIGTHDYRRIALDGVCLIMDQVAIDDRMDINDKAERIARLFSFKNFGALSSERVKDIKQRISYLNELGVFSNTIVSSPVAISRDDEGTQILVATGQSLVTSVEYIASEFAVNEAGQLNRNETVLSYEVEVEGHGHLSVPHIPGVTKLYSLSNLSDDTY